MTKKKRAIIEPLRDLKHKLSDDRTALLKISLRLRDWDRTAVGDRDTLIRHVLEDVEDINNRRLGETWDMVNKIIEEA